MARALMNKVDKMQEQMDNVSRDGNSKKSNARGQKDCNKHEKKCVDELSRFVTAEGTINEPEDMSTETSKVKKQRETRLKKKKNKNPEQYPRTVDNYKR